MSGTTVADDGVWRTIYGAYVRGALDACDKCPYGEPSDDHRLTDQFCKPHFDGASVICASIERALGNDDMWLILAEVGREVREENGWDPGWTERAIDTLDE